MKCTFKHCTDEATQKFDNQDLCDHHYKGFTAFFDAIIKATNGGTIPMMYKGKFYKLNKDKMV